MEILHEAPIRTAEANTAQALRRVLMLATGGVLPLVQGVRDEGDRIVVEVRRAADLAAWALHADQRHSPRTTVDGRTWLDVTWQDCPIRVMHVAPAAAHCIVCGQPTDDRAARHATCSPLVVAA